MAKMKKSEFKILVKECVRECIKEIMQEQINPTGLQEMFQSHVPQIPSTIGMINPLDDQQMRIRQEIIAQRGLIQGQLQRQASQNILNPMRQQVSNMPELAGLDTSSAVKGHYNRENDTGYTNPSDRLRLAEQSIRTGYDPRFDSNSGAIQQQQYSNKRVLRLDPALDTPIGGGDIRPPNQDVLRGIFEDTLKSTFIQQQVAEKQGPVADQYAAKVASHSPDELFMGSQNWAALAFNK
jgi:hypothetical protein